MRAICVTVCVAFVVSVISAQEQSCSNVNPCTEFKVGEGLQKPRHYKSEGGYLTVDLFVDLGDVSVDWLTLERRTYNGRLTGPTLWVRPGDFLTVTVTNNLLDNQPDKAVNSYGLPNSTNLHFHGLNAAQQVDDPWTQVDGGRYYNYRLEISEDQAAGTNWYHPFLHGSSLFQTNGGMAGLIIVEDDFIEQESPIQYVSCPDYCQHDVQMIFQPTMQYSSAAGIHSFGSIQNSVTGSVGSSYDTVTSSGATLGEWLADEANGVNYFTTNGQLQPKISIERNQVKRFRLVNAGGSDSLEIDVPSSSNGEICDVREIAVDGIYLNEPREPRSGQTLILPGSRVDWLIKCEYYGEFQIVSRPLPDNDLTMGTTARFTGTLATISVAPPGEIGSGEIVETPETTSLDYFPYTLPKRPAHIGDLRFLNGEELTGNFVLEANQDNFIHRAWFEGFGPTPVVTTRYAMLVDGVEEWTLLNTDAFNMHPVHIPVNHAQIVSHNQYNGPISVNANNQQQMTSQAGDTCSEQYEGFEESLALESYEYPDGVLDHLGQEERYWRNEGALGLAQIGEWRDVIPIPPLANITIRFRPHKETGSIVIESSRMSSKDQGMSFAAYIRTKDETVDTQTTNAGAYMGQCQSDDWYPPEPEVTPGPSPLLLELARVFERFPWYRNYIQRFIRSYFGSA